MRVLIIEDEHRIAADLSEAVTSGGYVAETTTCCNWSAPCRWRPMAVSQSPGRWPIHDSTNPMVGVTGASTSPHPERRHRVSRCARALCRTRPRADQSASRSRESGQRHCQTARRRGHRLRSARARRNACTDRTGRSHRTSRQSSGQRPQMGGVACRAALRSAGSEHRGRRI